MRKDSGGASFGRVVDKTYRYPYKPIDKNVSTQ